MSSAFTLIEMIGVLAVMAILATIIAPNILHSIDMAAVKAEETTLASLGEQIKTYTRQNGVPPTAGTWSTAIAAYADIASADVLTNKRSSNRVYVYDAPTQRVLLLSNMRPALALPSAATVSANFAGIWNWTGTATPPPGFAAAWSNPSSQTSYNLQYLVIQRINLQPIFLTDLRTFSVSLNNRHATTTVSYRITRANGTILAVVTIAPNGTLAAPLNIQPGDKIDLFRDNIGALLDYSAVFSTSGATARTFEFDAALAHWKSL